MFLLFLHELSVGRFCTNVEVFGANSVLEDLQAVHKDCLRIPVKRIHSKRLGNRDPILG